MNTKINQTQSNVGDKQKDMTKNAKEQIHAVEHHNKVIKQGMDKKVQEYEKDRIGQGRLIGQNFGIGGMNSEQKASEYLKGSEKAVQTPSTKPLNTQGNKK